MPETRGKLPDVERIAVRDGGLLLWHRCSGERAGPLFEELQRTICWQQHQVRVFAQSWPAPRLSAWHGDVAAQYRYSGLLLEPSPWTPALTKIRGRVEALTGLAFNAVLLNRYRDGQDGMGWHSDDEPELGAAPAVAAFSLGASRRLLLRRRDDHGQKVELVLADDSLLLMEAPLQTHWQHSLPKTRRKVGERISLTFRQVMTA